MRQVVGGMDHPVQVIASSLGAAFTIRAAAERPDLFDRLVLIEPTGIQDLASDPESGSHIFWRSILRSPLLGQGMYNAIASRPSIRFFLRTSYADPSEVSDDMIDYYYTQAHQPNARYAPASFIAGALDTPVDEEYMRLTMPILLLWGKNSRFTPLETRARFPPTQSPHRPARLRVWRAAAGRTARRIHQRRRIVAAFRHPPAAELAPCHVCAPGLIRCWRRVCGVACMSSAAPDSG